jgi:hypothetical protein
LVEREPKPQPPVLWLVDVALKKQNGQLWNEAVDHRPVGSSAGNERELPVALGLLDPPLAVQTDTESGLIEQVHESPLYF